MRRSKPPRRSDNYRHPEAEALLRPDIGIQPQFRKKKPAAAYRYDSSLAPSLEWDGQNPGREQGEAKIAALEKQVACLSAILDSAGDELLSEEGRDSAHRELANARQQLAELRALSKPFLNWAGKAERLSFEVPTLPLFVHERLSTAAILETLKGHRRDDQPTQFELFGESDLPIHDRVLKAYEHRNGWVNRLIFGDSLTGSRSRRAARRAASSTSAGKTPRARRSAASCPISRWSRSPTTSRPRRRCWSTAPSATTTSPAYAARSVWRRPFRLRRIGAMTKRDQETSHDHGYADHVERMIEVLRHSPVLRLGAGRTVTLSGVRRPARTISLSAEAKIEGEDGQIAAIVFGPENGAVSQNLVFEAAKEANVKGYRHLYVFGFAIQPDARSLIELSDRALGIPATYVQASPDLTMGDLLKNMRSSQIFSVCGLPEVRIERADDHAYRVHLAGLDVFDPATMETDHRDGADVPAWFLDTDYNGLCFHVCQAFFPRTSAWERLRNSLRGDFKASVWQHLSGTSRAPFSAGTHEQIAVKVIDDRANELLVVKHLAEADI